MATGKQQALASAHRSELFCRGASLPLSLACVGKQFFLAQQMLCLRSAKLGAHPLRLLSWMPQCPLLLQRRCTTERSQAFKERQKSPPAQVSPSGPPTIHGGAQDSAAEQASARWWPRAPATGPTRAARGSALLGRFPVG